MELKAKTLSLLAKIIAIAFAVICFFLTHIYKWNMTIGEIVAMSTFIAEAFVSVDVSLWINNVGKAINTQNAPPQQQPTHHTNKVQK